MEALKKNKTLLILFAVVLFIFIGYFTFFNGGGTTTTPNENNSTQVVGQNVLNLLHKISVVSIDTTIFSSPIWTNLRDISSPLPTNTPGKSDLFGALGQSGTASSVSRSR